MNGVDLIVDGFMILLVITGGFFIYITIEEIVRRKIEKEKSK